MKKPIILLAIFAIAIASNAQVGIGTTSPNTTIDVRGSLALNSRSFSSSQTVATTDYTLLFSGVSSATLTLPDATLFPGRILQVKNVNTGSVPLLTIVTASAQTIDGTASYLLDDPNEAVNIVSNGSNWQIVGQSLPAGSGSSWTQGGNAVANEQKIGTTDSVDLPVIADNIERMRFFASGSVSIGSDTLDPESPEVLRVDGGGSSSYNLINAVGNRNGYLQFNIQNLSTLGQASADIVATASNGTEVANYVNLGINGGGYNNSGSNILSGPNNGYLYSAGKHFLIGNSSAYDLIFFTGGIGSVNERMRMLSGGNICIGQSTANGSNKLTVNGSISASAFNVSSDQRLKTNIANVSYGLSSILGLQPVRWTWKDESLDQTPQLGLIAQDVKKEIPEIVSGDEKTGTLSINYTELLPILINAIKEQQTQIEALKKRVEILEKK